LKDLRARVTQGPAADALIALEKKAADLEGSEGGYGARFLSTPEGRSLARLNAGLYALLQAVDSADAAPTTQEISTFAEVQQALGEDLAAWNEIKNKDIPALNAQLSQAGQSGIAIQ